MAPMTSKAPAQTHTRTSIHIHTQVVLYHRHACEAVDEDSLLELADWAMRKLAYLNSDAHAAAKGE